jgi:hypothetical protein
MKLKRLFLVPIMLTAILVPLVSCGVNRSLEEIKADALPSVREYRNISRTKYKINGDSKIALDSHIINNTDLTDVVSNMINKIVEKLHLSTPLEVKSSDGNDLDKHDIYIRIVTSLQNHADITSLEAYQIHVGESIKIDALSNQAVI